MVLEYFSCGFLRTSFVTLWSHFNSMLGSISAPLLDLICGLFLQLSNVQNFWKETLIWTIRIHFYFRMWKRAINSQNKQRISCGMLSLLVLRFFEDLFSSSWTTFSFLWVRINFFNLCFNLTLSSSPVTSREVPCNFSRIKYGRYHQESLSNFSFDFKHQFFEGSCCAEMVTIVAFCDKRLNLWIQFILFEYSWFGHNRFIWFTHKGPPILLSFPIGDVSQTERKTEIGYGLQILQIQSLFNYL